MEIRITTKHILNVLNVLSWIIFLGLCVEAGGVIFNALYVLYKPLVAKYFWNGADLSALIAHDKGYFIVQTVLMSIAAVMKALLFYIIVTMFYNKKLSIAKPFGPELTIIVIKIAWLCLGAGFFSIWGLRYATWLKTQGINMPDVHLLHIDGGDVWLFMAVVLFVISQIFKKGSELQKESELTV
ncbi:MAG: DUF2975 domain-containing protein [Flavihumibacter sp.]|nr:DUF2975 domain-containing protein [Flavihumibacter sp.]